MNLVKTCGANLFQLVPSAELSIIIVDNLKQVRIVIIIIITSIIVTVIIIIIITSITMMTTRYLSEVFMTDNGDNGGTTVACPDGIICNGVIIITITIITNTSITIVITITITTITIITTVNLKSSKYPSNYPGWLHCQWK